VNGFSGALATPATRLSGAGRLIARWDLDKTYLRTEFDTFSDLIRTALERPDQKRAVPGASALLRELGETGARIHILSGSPEQMRAALEEKLRIDRVRWDELTLKPNLQNLLRLRFRALRDQLGYKLPILLAARVRDQVIGEGGERPREVLVGDDAEADAFVYSLYSDICEGLVDPRELRRVLRAGKVYADQRATCLELAARIRQGPVVERILIHLDRQSPPSHFDGHGRRLVPFYNYLQAAFVLCEDGRLAPESVLRVASAFVLRHRFEAESLARSYLDLQRRGHVDGSSIAVLERAAEEQDLGIYDAARERLRRMCSLIAEHELDDPPLPRPPAGSPDYVELAARHRGGRNRKRFHGFG
jgi:hypothetical protein